MESPTRLRVPTAKRILRVAGVSLLAFAAMGFYLVATSSRATLRYSYDASADVGSFREDGFLVASPRCHIPDVDPQHESIRKYLRGGDQLVCSRFAPLTYTTRSEDGRQTLRLDAGVAMHYVPSAKRLQCCYSVVTRVSDTRNNESACVPFISSVSLAASVDLVFVLCTDKKRSNKKVYSNVHALVQPRRPSNVSRETPSPPSPGERRLSVLLLGIDSMSRLNLHRSMPRTAAHLAAQGWLELRGYNKVGDNTIPNLMAILTGMDMRQLRASRCALPQSSKAGYDHCPFVWKHFKAQGYTTAYLEDENLLSTFNYMSAGFKEPPTDYYLHPLMVEAVKKLSVHKTDGLLTCLESTRTTNHYLKYTLELASATNMDAAALFALVWLNNFSHNNYNTPAVMDVPLFEFFQDLGATGALNDTLVVFLSDHGARFGKIRETYVGWLEERLPFLFVWVPTWFRERYPEAYQNLADNGGKLTSPFDLHLTLRDVVEDRVGQPGNGTEGCPTCVSLFDAVDADRGCEHAGISTHWCTCVSQEPTSTSSDVVTGAVAVALDDVNARLARLGNATARAPCAQLAVSQVLSARVKASPGGGAKDPKSNAKTTGGGATNQGGGAKTQKGRDTNIEGGAKTKVLNYDDYVVVFETLPGTALLDATVRHWGDKSTRKFQVMGMVSRINSIGSDGQCIQDKDLRLYCYCLQ